MSMWEANSKAEGAFAARRRAGSGNPARTERVELTGGLQARAVIFDFNGTLAADGELLYESYRSVLSSVGVGLTLTDYVEQLDGLSATQVIAGALERGEREHTPESVADLVGKRISLYKQLCVIANPITDDVVALVKTLASRIPVALGSGATREEVDFLLTASGLEHAFHTIVTIDDVLRPKPHPETFLRIFCEFAATTSGGGLRPEDVVVFEDSRIGVAAAKAAGMRCVARPGHDPAAVSAADVVVANLGPELIR
jgi:beta-phosphoglucomutase